MEKKTFKQFITEVPLGAYQTIGDFSKPHSFRGKTDPVLITSPKAIENVRKKFGKTPYVINMFFVNKPGVAKHTETGTVSLDEIRKRLGDDVANAVAPHYQEEDNVNIVFVSNLGAQKVPMTPWIMAHRMAHALARGSRGNMGHQNYMEVIRTINDFLSEVLPEVYGVRYVNPERLGYTDTERQQQRNAQLMMIHLFQEMCTFRSAREKKIRDYFEIYNELFAQYVIEGKIRFNPLPEKFGVSGWGKHPVRARNKEILEDYQSVAEGLARTLDYYFNELLREASKGVLLM